MYNTVSMRASMKVHAFATLCLVRLAFKLLPGLLLRTVWGFGQVYLHIVITCMRSQSLDLGS